MSEPTHEELLDWVERIAAYVNEQDGVPLIAGRVLGWLMICDPEEQTPAQIASAIGASRASLTTSLRQLRSVGLIRRTTRPGDQASYYGMAENAWFAVVRKQIASLSELRRLAHEGAELVGEDSARAGRVRNAYEMSVWLTEVFERALRGPGDSSVESDAEHVEIDRQRSEERGRGSE